MKLLKAIDDANMARPNSIPDEYKAMCVWEVEREIAEMMGVELPSCPYPKDIDLLMDSPYDSIYSLYVNAMIDYQNQEGQLYANDMVMYNAQMGEAKAWYRRHHLPKYTGNWSTL